MYFNSSDISERLPESTHLPIPIQKAGIFLVKIVRN